MSPAPAQSHFATPQRTGGAPQQLESHVFWFNRPPLMLVPVKLTLFLCSYVYASFIFFVWQFGSKSCPFE